MNEQGTGIGAALRRLEDERFLRGEGRYTGDLHVEGMLHGVFVRSSVAHGVIRSIDMAEVGPIQGVVSIVTGREAEADGLGQLTTIVPLKNRDGSPLREARRPVLPATKVHHVGQPLALVVAETHEAARDGAECVSIEIDELDAAIDAEAALADDAPTLHEEAPGNLAFDWGNGDWEKAQAALAAAPHRVGIRMRQARMVGAALEGRAVLADYDAAGERVVLHTASQGVHLIHEQLTKHALHWPAERLRVVTPDVGGGFGPKFYAYPEQAALAWAAWRLRRAVRWISERTESFVSETHARAQVVEATLGFDDEGRFQAIAVDSVADMGAFLSTFAPGIPTDGMAKSIGGLYTTPVAALRVRGSYTNTVPVDAYRGAGKPPMIYCLERLVDKAAAELGLAADEIRRRNLVPPAAMPFTTALGKIYDGGDYPAALDAALQQMDWTGFAGRAAESARRGLKRGRGLACNLHPVGGIAAETSEIRVFGATGRIEAWTGTQSTGQGHQTAFAQVLSERFGIPAWQIDIRQGDTDRLRRGGGTGGSSSTVISGATLTRAADEVIRLGLSRAADHLEASVEDIAFADGVFTVKGTDRRVSLFDLTIEEPLHATADFQDSVNAFPYGFVIAEVEVDPATGHVRLDRLGSVDDAGRIVNPLLLAGQTRGGLVQGVGQALFEHAVYDEASGQLIAGSFMDYCLPRADDLPPIEAAYRETLSSTNLLGVRGIGELGANGAPAAIGNAVHDALRDVLTTDLDPPFTAEKVWRALRNQHG